MKADSASITPASMQAINVWKISDRTMESPDSKTVPP